MTEFRCQTKEWMDEVAADDSMLVPWSVNQKMTGSVDGLVGLGCDDMFRT
jgi:hypothetical protein